MRKAETIAVAMSGAVLLLGVVESVVRELGPSEHADAVDNLQRRHNDGQ